MGKYGYKSDLTTDEKKVKSDDVSVFLENQELPAAEKIELPNELTQLTGEEDEAKEVTDSKANE